MTKEIILKEIKRMAAANGGVAPGRLALEAECGIREAAWRGVYWARWNEAIKEAGLAPNQKATAYPDEQLLEVLAGATKELGHFPTSSELRMMARQKPGFPSDNPLSRLGSKQERIAKLLAFCRGHIEFADVSAICERALGALSNDLAESATEGGEGTVYLLKSGRHYKLGHTNDLERRERELAYQTVEKILRVHSIRTDDPSGIEAYWHRRFSDKRIRDDGEWFALDANDVAAFRRRKKFM